VRRCLKINPVGGFEVIVPPSPGALPNEDIAFGIASWSKPERAPEYSVKYRWRDRNGRICRGGEFPVHSIARAAILALQSGQLQLSDQERSELREFVEHQ